MTTTLIYEKGKLYQIPITDFTQEQLGGIVGKARTTVRDILTINRLPQAIRDECRGIGPLPAKRPLQEMQIPRIIDFE